MEDLMSGMTIDSPDSAQHRLSTVASRDNECTYCTPHHVGILKQRWGYGDADVERVLHPGRRGGHRLDAQTRLGGLQ
jgi:hypothetical protein